MTTTLKLTAQEIDNLLNNKLQTDRFEEIFNDIPMYHPDHVIEKGETHRDYMDDGREYRWYIFKDTVTGEEHCINYTYNSEWPNDLMDLPKSMQIVDNPEESDLYVAPVPVVEPEPVLTNEQRYDKDLWAKYQAIAPECKVVEKKEKLNVPKATIDDILAFLKSEKFNILELRAKVIPVCIEYKLEEKSFWQWIQVKRGVWK